MAFSFLQITDHHLQASESVLVRGFSTAYSFRAVMRHIAQHAAPHADFILSMGDLVDPPTHSAYQAVRNMLGLAGQTAPAPGPLRITLEGLREFPAYFMPGNHDDRNAFFGSFLGQAPAMPLMNGMFEHKGVRLVCLDWGTEPTSVAYPETMAFLEQALETTLPSVILTHHHVAPVGVAWLDSFIAPGMTRFWEIVRGKNVIGILAGHVHSTHEQLVDGIPVWTLRSTGFQFARDPEPLITLQSPHYRFVTVQDGVLTSRVFEVPL